MELKNVSQDLAAQVQALTKHSEQVEEMLAQTLQVLARMGGKPPFDMTPLMQEGRTTRHELQKWLRKNTTQMRELQALVRISALITTSLELDEVLNSVIDTVIELTGAERVYLMMLKDEDDLQVMLSRNNKNEAIPVDEAIFSRGVIHNALEQKEPIITTNAQEDERFQNMASVISSQLRSIIVVPMLLQDKPMGVLYLDNRLASNVFHQDSLPILLAFANQAAIAIENARLFDRVQKSLERTRREVKQLRIQLDEQKVRSQTQEITSTQYFQELATLAKNMRENRDDQT